MICALLFATMVFAAADERIKYWGLENDRGSARAVLVHDAALAHTAQILPLDVTGLLVGGRDVTAQMDQLFKNLAAALKPSGSGMDGVVKINLYLRSSDLLPKVQQSLARKFSSRSKPAVSFVAGNVPHPDALVALDAVALAPEGAGFEVPKRFHMPAIAGVRDGTSAILPSGGRYYVSGQAKNGSLQEATRYTLTNLDATLTFLGISRSNVVQLKAFMQPISDAAAVKAEVARFFSPDFPPPVVCVEWISPTNTPIEIEIIASDGKPQQQSGDTVSYSTPPWMTPSKVFSRVAHVTGGDVIYISGLYGKVGQDDGDQVQDIFGELKTILAESGSDFEHLAKATYYVSTDGAGNKLNDIRPMYFNPARPPAASKAVVNEVGMMGRSVTMDLIAVTK